MSSRPYPLKKLGIIGGGQLARMMIYRAKKLGFHFTILDPDPEAGAASLADAHIVGGLYDRESLTKLVSSCEITTYDIEHTDTTILKELEAAGYQIFPSPKLLEIVQDKVLQKELYLRAGLPVADFLEKDLNDLTEDDFPVVQKARTGGYDGRGVQVLRSPDDLAKALPGKTRAKEGSFLEQFVPFQKEIGVMVARGQDGKTEVYPVVDMVFDPKLNICDQVNAPADLSADVEWQARDLALAAVKALDGVGVFGVELFLTHDGRVLLNETAPRPHNSGHYTMEACNVCQFENHVRAVCGLPLGEVGFHSPAVMVNLLGQGTGKTRLKGLDDALAVPGFSMHLYGKSQCRPGRKMGHFTITGPTPQSALERAHNVSQYLTVTGDDGEK